MKKKPGKVVCRKFYLKPKSRGNDRNQYGEKWEKNPENHFLGIVRGKFHFPKQKHCHCITICHLHLHYHNGSQRLLEASKAFLFPVMIVPDNGHAITVLTSPCLYRRPAHQKLEHLLEFLVLNRVHKKKT